MISRGTPGFWSGYRALPPEIRLAAQRAYQKFQENPAHPSLRLERLRSNPRAWSVRVTRDDNWFWIGSHRDFDREFPNA